MIVVVAGVGVRWWIGLPAAPPPAAAPPKPAPVPGPTATADLPFLRVEGSQLVGVDEAGKKQWELRAKTLRVDNEKNIVTLTELTGQLYQAGVPKFTFVAARGVLSIQSHDVEFSGGVAGRTAEGLTLQAPRIRWDAAHRQLVASGGVTLTQPGMVIHADQVTADATLHQTTFTGKIKVTVTQ